MAAAASLPSARAQRNRIRRSFPDRGLGELEIAGKKRASQLVGERAVAAGQLSDEGIPCDKCALGNVKSIQAMVSKTGGVHGVSLLARCAGPGGGQSTGRGPGLRPEARGLRHAGATASAGATGARVKRLAWEALESDA